MRKIREVLRLKFEQGRGHREIAASCGIGVATVSEYLRRARDSGVGWQEAQQRSDAELEAQLFPKAQYGAVIDRVPIDFGWVHRELRRTGVTLQLLWSEDVQSVRGQESYQYSQFCALYKAWRSKLDLVLGASNYTFAEATLTQKVADFIGSVTRGLSFFGGVPEVLVPDQLRSAVRGPDRYDPDINATLLELAKHYETTIIFSLEELNVAIGELVVELNARPFRKLDGSRRSVSKRWNGQLGDRCRSRASSPSNGSRRASTSTTTSPSRTGSTVCPTR